MPTEKKPAPFADMQLDLGTTISQSLWDHAIEIMNYCEASMPIGMLRFFYASQSGLNELPNPKYWQLCDGKPVTNPNSPLYGQVLPDLTNKFLVQKVGDQIVGTETGAVGHTINLSHNHGGVTASADDRGSSNADNGFYRLAPVGPHTHVINTTTLTPSVKPTSKVLQIYIRIV